ncbi:MAG: ubiquinol-cytochrome C chaperone family protein [Alphaproteobacteria bacterium]
MFGLLKKKNPYENAARDVYGVVAAHIREVAFYTDYGVPDTFDGRFDLMVLHVCLVMQGLRQSGDERSDEFNQGLFDAVFANMDQTLREMGIGDMGVPKRMRKMMKAFNGRMHAYAESLERGDFALVVQRNVCGVQDEALSAGAERLASYALKQLESLTARGFDGVLSAQDLFERP